ncbi:hypothetical protein BKA69DRAFT_1100821 [Paraphysoderma sedebokerense]|nr:hypothetical protein BKA69DRAFT_1100821 [Paraphysoderma sedebokerense]
MTHLSDMSYLERPMVLVCVLIWILIRIKNSGDVANLHPKYLINFLKSPRQTTTPLKLVITYLVIFSMTVYLATDIIITKFKYEEGYSYNPITKQCSSKPGADYSPFNKYLVDVTGIMLNVVFCSKSTALFLLIAFWSYTGSKIGVRKAFVTSTESKFCLIWAVVTVFLYPALQWFFISNKLISTIAPQFLYNVETLLFSLFGTVVNYRLSSQIHEHYSDKDRGFSGHEILKHHMRCNRWLILWNAIDCASIFAINIDSITAKVFNKFWLDFCIKLYTMGITAVFVIIILVLYPDDNIGSNRVTQASPVSNVVVTTSGSAVKEPSKAPRLE